MAREFAPRVVDSTPPVVLTIAAGREVEWVIQGMEAGTAPDTRVEVIHTIRFYPDQE